jgi:competence ComEA-like helix-hairpin-helix protein
MQMLKIDFYILLMSNIHLFLKVEKTNQVYPYSMLNNFLYHSTVERKATFVLLFLTALLWGLSWLWPMFSTTKKADFAEFKAKTEAFETDMALAELEEEETKNTKFAPKKSYDFEEDERYQKSDKYERKYKNKAEEEEPAVALKEPFPFDPNSADEESLLSLGLPKRTVRSIINFREKGGKFRQKSDLAKVYTLDEADYARLSAFIQLPDSLERKTFAERKPQVRETPAALDINSASAEDFQKLPGIGPSFAERIVKYRKSLGGFSKTEQVAEVFGLPDSTFQKISPSLRCSSSSIKKININTATVEELKTHPYLRWRHANAIVKYRTANGPYKTPETLRTIHEFDDAEGTYWKIKPYLEI